MICGKKVMPHGKYGNMYNIKELTKIYRGKKVLMTGHTGFKGAYACVLLKYLGAKVYGFSLKEEKASLYDLLKKELGGALIDDECYADIRDYKKIKAYMEKVKPDFVFHMAAQPLVLRSYDEPLYTYEVNVIGTANLLEAVRTTSFKHNVSVLNVTTDKVYENKDLSNYAFKEDDKLCGFDPYANSKSCSELVTYSYKKSFFDSNKKGDIRVSTARAGNVIGGGDTNKNRIIPDCFRAIKAKKAMEVRNPASVRPYQYVLEPLIIYLNIMAYQMKDRKYEGNYNIGPDKKACLDTKTLVEKFFEAYGMKYPIKYGKVKNAKHEAAFLRLDNSLVKKVFKYKEIFSMKKTMKYTAEVYKRIYYGEDVLPYIINVLENEFKVPNN